jgi:NADH-quinone oxidoreductase subunit C
MAPEEIAKLLQEEFPDAITDVVMGSAHPHVVVVAARWPQVAYFLRDDLRLAFNMLRCISGLDRPAQNELEAVYDLVAMRPPVVPQVSGVRAEQAGMPAAHEGAGAGGLWVAEGLFAVKVRVDRASPHIPSVAEVWPAADWHERETYDLLGIVFDGHPDSVEDHDGMHPRRILCPDDWAGYPLRKDYVFPIEYHGIPGTTEFEMPNPVH